jgi:lipoprotein-anchoring transpeptidase ErfK/SrfK
MRLISKLALAFVAIVAAPGVAYALVSVDVDLTSQTMRVTSGSGVREAWPISSGKSGHATPNGVFRPIHLYPMVHSYKYGNAPMPHAIFFHGQFAIHGTTAVGMLGRPASHGCIRLAPGNAAQLYAMVEREGAKITILGAPKAANAAPARRPAAALGYAPHRRPRTLREWARNPTAHP